jgi:hypothetical protein
MRTAASRWESVSQLQAACHRNLPSQKELPNTCTPTLNQDRQYDDKEYACNDSNNSYAVHVNLLLLVEVLVEVLNDDQNSRTKSYEKK